MCVCPGLEWAEKCSWFVASLLPFYSKWDYLCLQVQGDMVKRVCVSKVTLVYMKEFLVSHLLVIRIDGTAVNILILLLALQCVQACEIWICFTFYCFKILGFSSSSMPSQMLLSKLNPSFTFRGMLCVCQNVMSCSLPSTLYGTNGATARGSCYIYSYPEQSRF